MSDGRLALKRWWHENVVFISRHNRKTFIYFHLLRRRIVIGRMESGLHTKGQHHEQ